MTGKQLAALAAPFGIPVEGLERLPGGQNFVYRERGPERRILRISHGRHRTATQVEAELAWISHLAERGLRVCPSRPTNDGRAFHSTEVKGEICVAACFQHAPGVPARRDTADERVFNQIGRLTGMMHCEAKQAARDKRGFARPRWDESRLLREDLTTGGGAIDARFRAGVERLVAGVARIPETPATCGLIHADINFGNLFDDAGRLTIFDFDNCEYGHFLQDLATILYDSIYCKVLNRFADDGLTGRMLPLWRALMNGYAGTGSSCTMDPERLRMFFLLREAVIYGHYQRTLDLATVDESFHRGLEVIRRNIEAGDHQVDFTMLASAVGRPVSADS